MNPSSRPLHGGMLRGCLIAAGIFFVLFIVAGVAVALKWKSMAVALSTPVVEKLIAKSGLPPGQRTQLLNEVKFLGEEFKSGRLKAEDFTKIMQEIEQGPLMPLAMIQASRQIYLEPSTMNAEEKAAALRSLQRFARGVYEKKIPKEAIDDVTDPLEVAEPDAATEVQQAGQSGRIVVTSNNRTMVLEAKPTREEVDLFVALMKSRADAAEIPDAPFELDLAAEFRKSIDAALKRP